jgi:hypothetical protein
MSIWTSGINIGTTFVSTITLLNSKHSSMPSICSIQASPDPSRIPEGDLSYRMWLMKLNAVFYIKSRRRKLPNRSVQFLRCKAYCSHGKEEVRPLNLTGQVGLRRVVEQGLEDSESAVFQSEYMLIVFRWYRCRSCFIDSSCIVLH